MAKAKEKSGKGDSTIALNKRARHEYHIDERYEAGIALQGWEVKSLRAGRINLGDAYAIVKNGEIFLFGASIPPLLSASTHVVADDRRTRKLLLNRAEIDKRTQGLHARADRAVLEAQPRQGRTRPGQGQTGSRQARGRKRTRLESRKAARHAREECAGLKHCSQNRFSIIQANSPLQEKQEQRMTAAEHFSPSHDTRLCTSSPPLQGEGWVGMVLLGVSMPSSTGRNATANPSPSQPPPCSSSLPRSRRPPPRARATKP